MSRWQLIWLVVKVLCRLLFKRDISSALDIFAPKVEPEAPAPLKTASNMVYDVVKSRLVHGGRILPLLLLMAGLAYAGGSFTAYDGLTKLNKRITGGVGIDISAGGVLTATGSAVVEGSIPYTNISSAGNSAYLGKAQPANSANAYKGNSAPSATEFSYLKGVTGPIQGQISSVKVTAESKPGLSNVVPTMNGIGAAGTGPTAARVDHVHASDTSREPANANIQAHISSTSNPHSVTKSQVGLGNVDNTSDLSKPISTATQTALNLKANTASLATVATTGSYTSLIDKPATYTLPTASTTVKGGIKVDGTTIVMDGNGVASATVSAGVTDVNGQTGTVTVTPANIGAAALTAFTNYTTIDRVTKTEYDAAAARSVPKTGTFTASLDTFLAVYGTTAVTLPSIPADGFAHFVGLDAGYKTNALASGTVGFGGTTFYVDGAPTTSYTLPLKGSTVFSNYSGTWHGSTRATAAQGAKADTAYQTVPGVAFYPATDSTNAAIEIDQTIGASTDDRQGGIYSAITRNGGTDGVSAHWFEYAATAANTSGFDIDTVHMARGDNINGGTLGAQWLVAATPRVNSGGWNVYGTEINTFEAYADAGHNENIRAGGKWTSGMWLVPESELNVGRGVERGYHGTYGIVFARSQGSDYGDSRTYPAAKWHIPMIVSTDATVAGGKSIVLQGGSTAPNAPSTVIKVAGYQGDGVDFSGATFSGSAIKLGPTQTITDGTVTKTWSQVATTETSDAAYDPAIWDGDTTHAPSKNAVRDKIESILAFAGSGTVTNIATGTGLTGGPITSTGTISIANTAVSPGSYTNANITVDQQGRITAAANGSPSGVGGTTGSTDGAVLLADGTGGSTVKGSTVASVNSSSQFIVASPALSAGSPALIVSGSNNTEALAAQSFNASPGPGLRTYGALGNQSSPSPIGSGTLIGMWYGYGWNGTAWGGTNPAASSAAASILMFANETHSTTAKGAYIDFQTTAATTTTRSTKARIHDSGCLSVGNTANCGTGSISAANYIISGHEDKTASYTVSKDSSKITLASFTAVVTLPKTLPAGEVSVLVTVAGAAASGVSFAAESGGSLSWGDIGAPAFANNKTADVVCLSQNAAATTTAAWRCTKGGDF